MVLEHYLLEHDVLNLNKTDHLHISSKVEQNLDSPV